MGRRWWEGGEEGGGGGGRVLEGCVLDQGRKKNEKLGYVKKQPKVT